tara:strand:+ start:9397 stop:9720 length:324 start_codon:yes stop_codon:yes gene_type:complete
MPYTEAELQDNLYFQSIKKRDEELYHSQYQKAHNKFMDRESEFEENEQKRLKISMRDVEDALKLYEDPINGLSYPSPCQKLYVELYQRRYRTQEDTVDYIDRNFTEL